MFLINNIVYLLVLMEFTFTENTLKEVVMSAEKELGKKIKELRKQMGYTQERLAELVEIDAKNLSKIENGAHSPSFKTLKKLSKVLDFSLSDVDNLHHAEPLSKHLYYQKSLKILNSANSPKELQDYYKILKATHGIINNK